MDVKHNNLIPPFNQKVKHLQDSIRWITANPEITQTQQEEIIKELEKLKKDLFQRFLEKS